MGKKKSTKGRLKHTFTSKTRKAGSQIDTSKDQTLLGEPADIDDPTIPPGTWPPSHSQQGYSDMVYLLASVIFQNNHWEKPASHRLVNFGNERDLPLPEVKNKKMQRVAYQLAFSTLTYQDLLEGILIDRHFYLTHPMPDDQMSLVAVMLFDFLDRKFLPRKCHVEEEEIIQEVRDVEKYLIRFKTKLAASLARFRVKHNLLSVECFLPESVKKKQERSSSLLLYAWVNTLRGSLDEVQRVLKNAGFSQAKSIGQLEGKTFCQDPHCEDILVFPAQLKAQLYSTNLLSDYKLIIQDRSRILGPIAVCSLLPEEGDVLMVGCFSGLTVSHTASLILGKHKANSNYQPTVYVCVSHCTDSQREELQLTVSAMGCKNVKLILEVFQSLDSSDKRLQKVCLILLNPKCSLSAISNPVEFILQENEDTGLLQDLSQGSVAQHKLESLVAQQRRDLDYALMLPKVLAVVYSTCSSYLEENEELVRGVLQQVKARSDQGGDPKQAIFRTSPSPFISSDLAKTTEETEHFFTLEPSNHSNGCFLAVLSRQPEPKEAPQDVIARANAKGILDRISSNPVKKNEHRTHTKRMKKPAHTDTSQPHFAARKLSNTHQTKHSDSAVCCGHQESSQGKPKVLPLQPVKNTMSSTLSSSKRESRTSSSSSSSSSSKLGGCIPTKSIARFNAAAFNTTTLHSASPSAVAPVVRSRRAPLEVLKPVVLTLPSAHFPCVFPPQHSRTGFSPSFKSRMPARCSGGLSKDAMDKSHPLF
ncbi:putative methyltransferase NSUN7 [Parambassis ranga]|uniref:Methyltransferase NSUN7 n=1 Tax=Parambassis ranga TaxID=210632 RepID=A0A6P7J752_9TELE|nr:putative methyltransferase NSUN7 [Parambassis ranga]